MYVYSKYSTSVKMSDRLIDNVLEGRIERIKLHCKKYNEELR